MSRSLLALVLGASAVAVYFPCLRGELIWDDHYFIEDNPFNRDAAGLAAIWTTFTAADYWPLTYSAFWVEWRLWGAAVLPYHIVNLILHLTTGMLLAEILRRLAVRGWWLTALLFVVHPVNVECVAWIAQQKTLLATALLFAATLAFVVARSCPGTWNACDTLALVAFVLALLSKTSVVTFPIALLGYEQLTRRIDRTAIVRAAPFFIAALVGGLLTVACNAAHGTDVVHDRGLAERIAGAFTAGWFYLGKALVPIDLCFIYPRWHIAPGSITAWLPAAAWAGSLAGVVALSRWIGQPLLAGVGWYLVMLVPALGLIDIYFLSFAPAADHYQYQSLPGVLAAVVHVLATVSEGPASSWPAAARWRRVAPWVAAAVTLALAIGAQSRSAAYVDAETIWTDTLRRNPRCELACNTLGAIFRDRGDNERAIALYRGAIAFGRQPATVALAETNLRGLLALLAYRAGRLREAASELDVLVMSPNFPPPHLTDQGFAAVLNLRGKVASLLDDEGTAVRSFAASLRRLRSGNDEAMAYCRLAAVRVASASEAMLEAGCAEVVNRFPGTHAAARAHHEAGVITQRRGDHELAVRHFEATLRIEPHAVDTLVALAASREQLGDLAAAGAACARALEVDPDRPAVRGLAERLSIAASAIDVGSDEPE